MSVTSTIAVAVPCGVTVDALLAHSGAPRGSVYHHFPGGRDQIIFEAVRVAGRHIAALIDEPAEHDPTAVVRRFPDFWERILLDAASWPAARSWR